MKILISGASGLIGKATADYLSQKGHQILSLRRNTTSPPYWDLEKRIIDLGDNQDIDVVINLAGENIAEGRWNQQKKDRILKSRVEGTELIAAYFSKAEYRPKVIISGSAIGIYGNRGAEELTEESARGSGFLPEVCYQWERSISSASSSGIRVVCVRFGMVLSAKGGALEKMILPFKIGLGGIIGNGDQYISWISINDVAGAISHIINNENLDGPINLVSPIPVTNFDFTKVLGKTLHRPTVFSIPAFFARLLFGEMAEELLLASTKVIPKKLLKSGYSFQEPTLDRAFDKLLSSLN
ncbi:MAG: TIGR01777 family protein [Deltaproteobacteria bacterium RIFOXYD12_FULL_50_9]|nr:MAG: TIGR01777 family protein [Deltaproteobacteria bacterium RIFOXYD12_FULL_50_9]